MQVIGVNGTTKEDMINWVWFPIFEQLEKRKSENSQSYQKRYLLISDSYHMYSERVATIWLL